MQSSGSNGYVISEDRSYKNMASAYFPGLLTLGKPVTQAALWRHPQMGPSNSQVSHLRHGSSSSSQAFQYDVALAEFHGNLKPESPS